MAKKPSPQTPGGKGKGGGGPPLSKAGGGWVGHAPAHHHPHHTHHTHHHHKPGGGPMTPGGPGGPPLARAGGGWVGKAPQHKKAKKHPKRKLAGAPLGGGWILGGNDAADNCAAVAVANALLELTGHRVPDAELLRIHDRAGPLSIAEALAAAREVHEADAVHERRLAGLGIQHHAELDALHIGQLDVLDDVPVPLLNDHPPAPRAAVDADAGDVGRCDPALIFVHPLIVGLATPYGPHAALLLGDALITWGGEMALPGDWDIEEAWAVTW